MPLQMQKQFVKQLLENAKIALEEAFTPRLQSMLSKKIQSEIEDDEQYEDGRWVTRKRKMEAPEEGMTIVKMMKILLMNFLMKFPMDGEEEVPEDEEEMDGYGRCH